MANEVYAPYNFIPFPEKIIKRYNSVDELPSHESYDPELYSGKIRIKVTAETPVFISNGDDRNPGFYRNQSGKFCIPGSTIRGLIRENVQILSLSSVNLKDDIEERIKRTKNVRPAKAVYGLRNELRELAESTYPVLDYVHSIFGFASGDFSYKSRVSFGDLACTKNGIKEMVPITIVPGEPKPSFELGYLRAGGKYDYKYELRGYKQYWFKDAETPDTKKSRASREITPLNAGTTFVGTIHYKNLKPDELGLLLWSLLYTKSSAPTLHHGIGNGKPYGYGRVNISLLELVKYNYGAAYVSLDSQSFRESIVNEISSLVAEYRKLARELYNQGLPLEKQLAKISDSETIESFLYMHSTIMSDNSKYKYPDIRDFQGFDSPLPTVLEIKNNVKNANRDK